MTGLATSRAAEHATVDLRRRRPRRWEADVNADRLCSCAEAAEYLSTGERFVRRLVAERRIAYVKVGKFVRIPRSELDRFISSGRVEAH
jgi:excisionase family DNA binding protein